MDQIAQQIGSYLVSQGPLGILAAVLAYMLWRKEAEIKDVRTACDMKLDAAQKRIDELNDKRLTEALTLQQLVAALNDKEDAFLAAIKGATK